MKNSITLDFYKEAYKPKLQNYHLSEEQNRYAPFPMDALLTCKEDSTRCPIVILYQGEPAGFFVLHGWKGVQKYSDNKEAILIRAYSINASYQGKGIATESLRILDSFVKEHFPDKSEIILAVNHQNTNAQHVYQKAGFTDKGLRTMGPKGELYIFHKPLK
ncbi:Acetyltransferase (GNAT) domain-containing protein [Salinibacillus kushneri]|uniref:Acetyltransferase (GNAT) domain-containing protein n=1 Tax=Salinibacillus kushneri TaxID=237682 RepID=A0A1I0EYM1_9BACI|nr:GNAT family N-acetyltransferase [Salinibacillus kushneri]SET50640.1 Acetyltransferase (GNAT) domain-containing protein [Salinibacillus kushneri]